MTMTTYQSTFNIMKPRKSKKLLTKIRINKTLGSRRKQHWQTAIHPATMCPQLKFGIIYISYFLLPLSVIQKVL